MLNTISFDNFYIISYLDRESNPQNRITCLDLFKYARREFGKLGRLVEITAYSLKEALSCVGML
jgi:hypothetical protein